jgi:hypothetical protein
MVYVLPPITYAIFSLGAGRVATGLGNKTAILLGLFLSSLGYVMIGPPPLLRMKLDGGGMWAVLLGCLFLMGESRCAGELRVRMVVYQEDDYATPRIVSYHWRLVKHSTRSVQSRAMECILLCMEHPLGALADGAAAVSGLGETLILVPAVPLMISTLERCNMKKNRDPGTQHDAIAGIFNCEP